MSFMASWWIRSFDKRSSLNPLDPDQARGRCLAQERHIFSVRRSGAVYSRFPEDA
jgi:hypothetical protein